MDKTMHKGGPSPLLALLMALCAWQAAWASGDLVVEQAWVREAPPGTESSAAYLILHNQSAAAQTLMGVSSPQFKQTEMHATRLVQGQVRMKRLTEVIIAPHATLEFRPEGNHLMLLQPTRPLKAGDKIELRLQFKNGPPLSVEAEIRKGTEADDMHQHHDMPM